MSKRSPARSATPNPALTDNMLRQFVGYRIKRAYLTVQAVVSEVLDEYGLKITGFSALAIIIENPGLTQTTLAQALQIERSSVVVIVDTLEDKELITRNRVEGDRRTYALMPTLRGRRVFDRMAQTIQKREERLQAELTEEEREILAEGLSAIEKGLGSPNTA
ncbi:MAG: MarR family winged helix-turn-helix transcriptional regulator [Mangrovicoccus sp.]